MSGDASRARSIGPFVQIVASATWLSAIDGFCSTASSSSTCVGSASCFVELPQLSLRVVVDRRRDLDVPALHVKPHRASSIGSRPGLRLPNGPREGHDLDAARAGRAERRRGRVRRARRSCRRRRRDRRAPGRRASRAKAPRTLRRRSASGEPALAREPARVRRARRRTGSSQRSPSSRASRCGRVVAAPQAAGRRRAGRT